MLAVATAAALVAAPEAQAQAATGGTIRLRCRGGCASASRDSSRVRREQLLLKFDSLRYEFDHQRSEAERDRIAAEMRKTVMAVQESFGDPGLRASAFAGTEIEHERMPMPPDIAIAVQTGSRPRGYLGVSFDGPHMEEIRRDGQIIRFLEYPRIALVEPSSPAERAGIQEGDTLLALDGNDVRQREISLTKLLVPDHRIMVRVRRDGNRKDFRVTVDETPGYVMSRMPPMSPMSPMSVRVYSGEELPRRAATATPALPPMPAMPPGMVGSMWIFNDAVGGAKLETISEGLGRALGTKAGVLVLRALPGTPAYESGLRDGDVILNAGGKAVSSVRELRGVLMEGDLENGVKLAILRERKQREVTLKW
jgi:membrane-associated protease RseP (regulator of RpoE activity)